MLSGKILLNLGAGVIDFDRFSKLDYSVIIHVDRGYSQNDINEVNQLLKEPLNLPNKIQHYLVGMDIFDFLDTFKYKVDDVFAERIFEHMEYVNGSIGRLLEAINIITKPTSNLMIIVPDAVKIAKMVIDFDSSPPKNAINALKQLLLINTENHNFKQDSHASSWSPTIAKYYIEPEGTWNIDKIEDISSFASRDIYIKIKCSKK